MEKSKEAMTRPFSPGLPFTSVDDLIAYSARLDAPRVESAPAEDDDRASPPDDEETT